MKILLVDDEKLQLKRLEESVKNVLPTAELVAYTNPVLALKENKVLIQRLILSSSLPLIDSRLMQ